MVLTSARNESANSVRPQQASPTSVPPSTRYCTIAARWSLVNSKASWPLMYRAGILHCWSALCRATSSSTFMCFQPYHRPTAWRTWRIRLSASPGSVFQSWVVPYSSLAIMSGGAGSAFGSLRRSGVAGSGSGGIPSAAVCRVGF